jgi:hypothetical protein
MARASREFRAALKTQVAVAETITPLNYFQMSGASLELGTWDLEFPSALGTWILELFPLLILC